MLYLYLWLFPLLAGIISWIFKNRNLNRALVLSHAVLHLGAGVAFALPSSSLALKLGIDNLSIWFFFISSVLYFSIALYSLKQTQSLSIRQSTIYAICMMAFVASMDGANLSRDLGIIWVFVETTTLASAMLISFEHRKQSLEAAWKYLFICSIGIALAFVGILLLVIAMPNNPSLLLDTVLALSETISPFWLKVSFVFILIGFGTKVGIAPLHFWLPDAHSEAPAPVSALLSGALLNTALLPLLRMKGLMTACHMGSLASELFLIMGLASMFIAAVFIMKVKNYKRLLAYSSIENMGIILIAFAMGGWMEKAGLIHVMGHSLIKAAFFLCAGNVYSIYAKKDYDKCGGLLGTNPASGWLWLISFMFIVGMPPSPLFVSEFFIAMGLLKSGYFAVLIAYFILLACIAYGLGRASLKLNMGSSGERVSLPFLQYLPQALLLFGAVFLPFMLMYLLS